MARLTQDDLLHIFDSLKPLVKPYENGLLKPRLDIQGKYDLWVEKKVFAHGKWRDDVFFVALMLQSSYVGFYFMPIYTNPEEVTAQLSPALLKCLKGKSCFHIKKVTPEILEDIVHAMEVGYSQYEKNGWL